MTLYGAAKAPGDPLREAGTTVVALTDSSGGTATETIANIKTLTIGGTYNQSEVQAVRNAAADAVADLAAKIAALITHLDDGR